MSFDFITIPKEEYLRLQIEEYKRIMLKDRDAIVKLRIERDEALEKLNKIKKVQRELAQKLGRSPSPTEIAKELDLEPAQLREYLNIARQPISLDVRVGDNQDTELQEMLEDEGISPEHYTTQEFLRHDLNNLLAELTPQQREVVILRFGLEDGNEMSLAKVGERLNISRERVRQLEHQALTHLRRRRGNVKEYVTN